MIIIIVIIKSCPFFQIFRINRTIFLASMIPNIFQWIIYKFTIYSWKSFQIISIIIYFHALRYHKIIFDIIFRFIILFHSKFILIINSIAIIIFINTNIIKQIITQFCSINFQQFIFNAFIKDVFIV